MYHYRVLYGLSTSLGAAWNVEPGVRDGGFRGADGVRGRREPKSSPIGMLRVLKGLN